MNKLQEQREMREACEIQRRLLPADLTHVPGVEIAMNWRPARELGGDYFDVLRFPDGSLGLCIADVEGKGLPAALVMSSLQAAVRALASAETEPRRAVRAPERDLLRPAAGRAVDLALLRAPRPADPEAHLHERGAPPARDPPPRRRARAPERGRSRAGADPALVLRAGRRDPRCRRRARPLHGRDDRGHERGRGGVRRGPDRGLCLLLAGGGPAELQRRILAEVAAHCGSRFRDDATLAVLEVA